MQIGVLGRLEVLRDGSELDLGPRKQRAVLAALALHLGELVSLDRLADLLWGGDPPAATAASVHGYVAALRRVLEPDRAARSAGTVLLTAPPGYRLHLPESALDAARFAAAANSVHRLAPDEALPAPKVSGSAQLEELLERCEAVLGLWRGTPYPDLDAHPDVEVERTRLQDLHRRSRQDRARLLLAVGRPAVAVTDLTVLVSHDPLRADTVSLMAVALARSGRSADALQVLRGHRNVLAEELGLDPEPQLQQLELAILRQDRSVFPDSALTATATATATGTVPAPADHGMSPLDQDETATGDAPMVGRNRELSALRDLLRQAADGVPQFAVIAGEAGIGKTRLVAELAETARQSGFLIAAGRCSSDEGAPPLWPWLSVLEALTHAHPEVGSPSPDRLLRPTESQADRFRLFDRVVDGLRQASSRTPVLLTLEDVHWADPSTLRLLQHLVEDAEKGRLCVLITRRTDSEPRGPLADLGAAMARRHVLRFDLAGLTAPQVRDLAGGRGPTVLDAHQAQQLRERTGGNPFYLVELLRWREALAGPGSEVPPSVGDVIAARVAQLPADTQQLLRTAAALNRDLDLGLLAALTRTSIDQVLDSLDPAMTSGLLVVDADDGAVRFSHALIKEAVEATDPPLRRQRRHAQLAQHLATHDPAPPRLSEIAHHWLQAGPAHVSHAWPAAARAAEHATAVAAHEEAAALLAAAVTSQRRDPGPSWQDRYELLLTEARACRAAADSDRQRAAAAEAMRAAADAGDLQAVAVAAATSSEGALWSNRPEGEVDTDTVDALHRAVAQLPAGDSELRCRVFLALSRELFWAPGRREAEAHAEQALAMARRLHAPGLQALGCHAAIVTGLRPDTWPHRMLLAENSVACARAVSDPELEAVGLFWQAVMAGEGGQIADRDDAVAGCRRLAAQHRLRYLQVMLECYDVPWLAMRGQFAEATQELALIDRWAAQAAFPFRDEAIAAAHAWVALHHGNVGDLLDSFSALDQVSPTDMGTTLLLLLLRDGRLDAAAAHLHQRPIPLVDDNFAVTLDLAIGAEAALLLQRPELAAAVYPLMTGWSGRVAAAGTGAPLGPVDAFLALAAAAVGETALASTHADDAARLCETWRLTSVSAWLVGLRERFRF